jgi:hypothetical protein
VSDFVRDQELPNTTAADYGAGQGRAKARPADALPANPVIVLKKVCWFTSGSRITRVAKSTSSHRRPAASRRRKPVNSSSLTLLVRRRSVGNDGGWVFGADSKSGHIEEPKFALALVAKATGIAVSAHDLRRTFVTVANGTVSGRDARALVNHAVGGNVHDDYDMVTVDELREPARRICDKLMKLCGIGDLPEGVAKMEAAQLTMASVPR